MDDRVRHAISLLREAEEILRQVGEAPTIATRPRWRFLAPHCAGTLKVMISQLEKRLVAP